MTASTQLFPKNTFSCFSSVFKTLFWELCRDRGDTLKLGSKVMPRAKGHRVTRQTMVTGMLQTRSCSPSPASPGDQPRDRTFPTLAQRGLGSRHLMLFQGRCFTMQSSVLLKWGTRDMKCLFLLNTHSVITMPSPGGACLWGLCNGFSCTPTDSQDMQLPPYLRCFIRLA